MQYGTILGMGSANERRRYNVTSSLIGWSQNKNDPCMLVGRTGGDIRLCLVCYYPNSKHVITIEFCTRLDNYFNLAVVTLVYMVDKDPEKIIPNFITGYLGSISQMVYAFIVQIMWTFLYTKFDSNDLIRWEFCTCHDSSAVVACAKLWRNWIILKTATRILHQFSMFGL